MRILSRYLAARFLTLFAAILFASTLSISVVELLLNFDDVLAVRARTGDPFTYLLLRVPSYYLVHLIPMSAFAASFLALGLAARWRELTALSASGVSPRRAAAPILVACAALAIGSHFVAETLILQTTRAWSRQHGPSEDELTFRQGAFWYHRGRTIYNITGADRESRTLRGVRLYRRDDLGRPEINVEAELVTIGPDGVWLFENARVRRFEPNDPEAAPEVQIGVDLPLAISDESDAILLDADAGSLPLARLREYIATNTGRAYPGSEASLLRLRRLLHERLSAPFTVVVFGLLAIPIGLRASNERGLGSASLRALVTLAGFFLVRSLAAGLASAGLLPPALASWGVLSGFALWGGAGLLLEGRT